jgi:hypothetical protein
LNKGQVNAHIYLYREYKNIEGGVFMNQRNGCQNKSKQEEIRRFIIFGIAEHELDKVIDWIEGKITGIGKSLEESPNQIKDLVDLIV